MPVRFSTRIEMRSQSQDRSFTRILAGLLLIAGALVLLWFNRGFALYAVTGLFWSQTEGRVMDTRTTSKPTVQFATADGTAESFKEDYIQLCGGRSSFCFIRSFAPGERVPVVFDPSAPQNAYIHDWALTASVLTWFIMAGALILFLLITAVALVRRPFSASISFDRGPESR